MDTDGAKRKLSSSASPSSNPVYQDSTGSAWALPAQFHKESSTRSTQSWYGVLVDTVKSHSVTNLPSSSPSGAAFNNPPKRSPPLRLSPARRRIYRTTTPRRMLLAADMMPDATDELCVDTESGNDNVYMINVGEGSWSGSLQSEDDPAVQQTLPFQAELALSRLLRKQKLAEQNEQFEASEMANKTLNAIAEDLSEFPQERAKRQKDLRLRDVLEQIKRKLRNGGMFTVESMGPVNNLSMKCAHPYCPALERRIPGGAYYCMLSQPKESSSPSSFCLACLESLWNGVSMIQPYPSPLVGENRLVEHEKTVLGLDGVMDVEKLSAPGVSCVTNIAPCSTLTRPSSQRWESKTTTSENNTSPAAQGKSCIVVRKESQISSQVHGIIRNFGDSWAHKIRKDSAPEYKLARRSDRLQPTAKQEIAKSSRGSQNSKISQTRTQSTKSKKVREASAIGKEAAKADAKLAIMYEQREKASTLLTSNTEIVIKHPSCTKGKANNRSISMDMFEVIYTDLLGDHSNYWMQQPRDGCNLLIELPKGSISGPLPEQLRFLKNVSHAEGVRECWCTCRGVDGGQEMIECDNMKCLIGWYHVDCVSEGAVKDEKWLCQMCRPLRTAIPACLPKHPLALAEELFAPSYAEGVGPKVYHGLGSTQMPTEHVPTSEVFGNIALPQIPQFDGSDDLSPSSYQRQDSFRSNTYDGPQSLLSSKHAPTAAELSCAREISKRLMRQVESPPNALDSPTDSLSSTTDSEDQCSPPTRFTYLAAFIRPGSSLSDTSSATIELWTKANEEQCSSQGHLKRVEEVRTPFAALLRNHTTTKHTSGYENSGDALKAEDGMVTAQEKIEISKGKTVVGPEQTQQVTEQNVDNHVEETDDDERLVKQAGRRRRSCRGKNLTWLLT